MAATLSLAGLVTRSIVLLLLTVAGTGLAGWLVQLWRTVSTVAPEDPGGRLAGDAGRVLGISYLPTWLRATVLNPRARQEYWHCDNQLWIREIVVTVVIDRVDAAVSIVLRGKNQSDSPVNSCPMVMFGGSVIHYRSISERGRIRVGRGDGWCTLTSRSRLDLGQFQLVEMISPVAIPVGDEFEIEQIHEWPKGMVDGEDSLWFPYGALFARDCPRLTVRMAFDRPLRYLKPVELRVGSGVCVFARNRPRRVDGTGLDFLWEIEPVDNEIIYGIVFDRTSQSSSLPGTESTSEADCA